MNIEQILATSLSGLGYECVDFELTVQGVLRIYIDKPDGICIDDCALVSSHLSRIFLVENIDYKTLEISSPGLDRVLKKPQDFIKFKDYLITLKTKLPIEHQKKFVGRIIAFENQILTLNCEHKENVQIDFTNIEKARIKPEI